MEKPFDIPNFHGSIKRDYEAKLITIEQAAEEFYQANYTSFIDLEYTRKQLRKI